MGSLKPLSDAWLFWDAEQLEGYPHSDGVPSADTHAVADHGGDVSRSRWRMRLLAGGRTYLAGVTAALIGVGFAVLLGSFISAYSMLSAVDRGVRGAYLEYASSNVGRYTKIADAAGADRLRQNAVMVSSVKPESLQTGSEGVPSPRPR